MMNKKMLIAAMIVAMLSMSGAAYAWWGGGPMWGWGGVPSWNEAPMPPEPTQKALDESSALRREIHVKMFDYMEAQRKGDQKQAETLYYEITAMRDQLATMLGMPANVAYGMRGDHGGGCPKGGPANCNNANGAGGCPQQGATPAPGGCPKGGPGNCGGGKCNNSSDAK